MKAPPIPLFPDPRTEIDRVEAKPILPGCEDCALHGGAHHACMPPAGPDPDDLVDGAESILIVGPAPTREDDLACEVNSSSVGVYIRELTSDILADRCVNVFYDNAIKCPPGGKTVSVTSIRACRPYLRRTIDLVRPLRIIALGRTACQVLFGDPPQLNNVLGGYQYLADPEIPVFVLPHPIGHIRDRNRFVQRRWEAAYREALIGTVPENAPLDMVAQPVEASSAFALLESVAASEWVVFDVETDGRLYCDDFRVVAIGVLTSEDYYRGDRVWVWGEQELRDSAALSTLREVLLSPTPKIGHNYKYDEGSCASDATIDTLPVGFGSDTMLARWFTTSCNVMSVALGTINWLVGLGGHKSEAEEARKKIKANMAKQDAEDALGRVAHLIPRAWLETSRRRPAASALLKRLADEGVAAALQEREELKAKVRVYEAYSYAPLPRDILLRYCALDVLTTAALHERGRPELLAAFRGAIDDLS